MARNNPMVSQNPVDTLDTARCVLLFLNETVDGLTTDTLSEEAAVGFHSVLNYTAEVIGDAMDTIGKGK